MIVRHDNAIFEIKNIRLIITIMRRKKISTAQSTTHKSINRLHARLSIMPKLLAINPQRVYHENWRYPTCPYEPRSKDPRATDPAVGIGTRHDSIHSWRSDIPIGYTYAYMLQRSHTIYDYHPHAIHRRPAG